MYVKRNRKPGLLSIGTLNSLYLCMKKLIDFTIIYVLFFNDLDDFISLIRVN